MTDLLTSLVHQVRQVLPSNLIRVDVEDTTCCGHVPSRGVTRAHVQDHVHVFQGEGAAGVQQLVVHSGPREKGVVLKEVDLRSLVEIFWLPLRQQVHAKVVIDTVASGAGGRRPDVQVLVVSMGHDDFIARSLVDLRSRDWVMGIRLKGTEHLASKGGLHRVCVVVHEDRVFGLEKRLDLQEACDRSVRHTDSYLGKMLE
mmetsp:Transcript_116034/g.328353  ORF Transcript_116034/g.328353 Transcript_116034/m.328353 type:complete len:200 (-) Transcript_116034:384-983(-)